MKRIIADYKIIISSNAEELAGDVLSTMATRGEDWEPLGGVSMSRNTDSEGYDDYVFAQAIVRYEYIDEE